MTTAPASDPARNALLIGNYLSEKGFSRQFVEELTERLIGKGWHCVSASNVVWRPLRLAHMIVTTLRTVRGVSVVHIPVFSGPAFIWAEVTSWIASRAGTPIVMSLHGGNLPMFARRHPERVRRTLNRAVIALSPSAWLQQQLRPYRGDIEVVPNPIDLGRYEYRERANPSPKLVWLRAFSRIYNPAMAPRVLALIRRRYPAATLTMYGTDRGDGSYQETIDAARSLGVSDAVHLPGGIPKAVVPLMLQGHDIFINTTRIDNTPVSVTEAMALGLPVVSTNVGGVPYLVTDGQDGLLVPTDDAEAMADAVLRVLSEPGLASRLGRAARSKVEAFDWAHTIDVWDGILLAAARRKGVV